MTEAVGIVAAGFAAGALLERGRRRAGWALGALALALALLLGDQWGSSQVEALRESVGVAIFLGLLGLALVGGLAWLFLRLPAAFPVAVVLALPFRVPVELGGETSNLLIPLYVVVAAGTVALLIGGTNRGAGAERSGIGRLAGAMVPLLAASVLLYAVGIIWSQDPGKGLQDLCFFLIPFAVLFALVTEVEWDSRTLRLVFGVLVVQALVCAAVGFGQYLTRELFWNEAVIRSNDFHVYFRVNSLFWDPNLYGRYLALVITVTVAVLAWARDRRTALWLAAGTFILWLSLVTTFSQSSFFALIAGLAAVLALRWSLRAVLAGIAAAVVAGVGLLAFGGELVKLDLDRLNPQTGGRADLVSGGLELFGERPVAGFGSGSFSLSFREEVAGPDAPVTESHTEPVTIAAESGIVGLAVYLALITSSLALLLTGARASMPGLGRDGEDRETDRGPPAARAAILAAYVGLLVHTIFYAGYLDDPATWVLLAIGYCLASRCRVT